jgi:hypothetical protein
MFADKAIELCLSTDNNAHDRQGYDCFFCFFYYNIIINIQDKPKNRLGTQSLAT